MKREIRSVVRRLRRDERGAVIVLVAFMIIGVIGLGAMAVDVGNLVYVQSELQAITDAAAQAGAAVIPCGNAGGRGNNFGNCAANSAITAATAYSGVVGSKNAQSNLNITMVSGYPQLTCNTTYANSAGVQCTASTAPNPNANEIIVKEQAEVPFLLGQVFGFGTVTLTATSYASKGGGLPPMHIMVVVDNTGSMSTTNDPTTTCGGRTNQTKLECALWGVQTMLAELWPTQDEVGMMVFPPLSNSTSASNDASCSTSKTIKTTCAVTPNNQCTTQPIVIEPYSDTSATYLVAPLANNYKSSNTATTLESSTLVNATCQPNSQLSQVNSFGITVTYSCGTCTGVQAPGGESTYLASAIQAAMTTLCPTYIAGSNNNNCTGTGWQDVIIVLSDGGAGNASTLGQLGASQLAPIGTYVLTFSSTVPAAFISGTSVADLTTNSTIGTNDTLAIPAGAYVMSTSGNTVTLSQPVAATAYAQTNAATSSGANLQFLTSSLPTSVKVGMGITDTNNAIPVTPTPYTIKTITKSGSNTIVQLSAPVAAPVASGAFILFGGVQTGDTISFGGNNQCNEAIIQAQDAAQAGAWVYAIAYQSYTNPAPNQNSCSDVETAPIANVSSCQTMQNIANSPGNYPDESKFFSDPMGLSPACTSSVNGTTTSLGTIFSSLGLAFTALLPNVAGN
jgi:Flp pilus assembly protein TadG